MATRRAANAADASLQSPAGWLYKLEQAILAQTKDWKMVTEFDKVLDNQDTPTPNPRQSVCTSILRCLQKSDAAGLM